MYFGFILEVQQKGKNLVFICENKTITIEPKAKFFFELNQEIPRAYLTEITQSHFFDDNDESEFCCVKLSFSKRKPCYIRIRSDKCKYDSTVTQFSIIIDDKIYEPRSNIIEMCTMIDQLREEPPEVFAIITTWLIFTFTFDGNKYEYAHRHTSNKNPWMHYYNVKVLQETEVTFVIIKIYIDRIKHKHIQRYEHTLNKIPKVQYDVQVL